MRGRERLHEAARRRPVDLSGTGSTCRCVDRDELRLARAGQERHHPLARLDELTGALEPGHVLRAVPGGGGYFPAACIRSALLIPAACTRISTSPVPGTGSGRSATPSLPSLDHDCTHRRWQDTAMRLHGIHHVTCITGDAPQNVAFYTDTLGLRMVKKTVNQDDPTVYHLFYADENGSAGADITFFEYPGAIPGPRGRRDGASRRLPRRQRGVARLLAGARRRRARRRLARLRRPGGARARTRRRRRRRRATRRAASRDPRGARAARLRGRARLRVVARSAAPTSSRVSPSTARAPSGSRAVTAHGFYVYDEPPDDRRGIPGAGTVHHVAWSVPLDEHAGWVEKAAAAGARPTPVIDRFWFRSIYFREPSGILFEIASLGPGLHRRRGPRAPRREADPAAGLRASARAGRAATDAAARARAGDRPRAARERRARRARSSSSTGAAPTSTTSSRCSTCSTRSAAWTATRPRAALAAARRRALVHRPARRLPRPRHVQRVLPGSVGLARLAAARASRARRLLAGLRHVARARPRHRAAAARLRSPASPASSRSSTAGSPTSSARCRRSRSGTAPTTR